MILLILNIKIGVISMKKVGIAIISVVLILGITLGSFAVLRQVKIKKYSKEIFPIPQNIDLLEKEKLEASYLFDTDDKELMSGASKYIVIAYLNKITGTSYKDVEIVKGEAKGTPFTNYTMNIVKNIKGNLKIENDIPVLQYGGVSIDGKKMVFLYPLLEENTPYVLYLDVIDSDLCLNKAYVIPEVDSFEELKNVSETDTKIDIIEECILAYENEDPKYATRKNGKSPYDLG